MKLKTIQESYTSFLSNEISKAEFQRAIKLSSVASKYVSPSNSVEDCIKILKNKKIISENASFAPNVGDQKNEPIKEIKRINQPNYTVYVYSVDQGKLIGGYENADDAREFAKQAVNTVGNVKVLGRKAVQSKYSLDPNDNGSWGNDHVADPDGNDELSEDASIDSKITSDIDSLLHEIKGILGEGWEDKLPDTYDSDLKAAGLSEMVNELSNDTVFSASDKLRSKGELDRSDDVINKQFSKYIGSNLSQTGDKIANIFYDGNDNSLSIHTRGNTRGLINYHMDEDIYDLNQNDGSKFQLSDEGIKTLRLLARSVNPQSKYVKSVDDLNAQGV